MSYLPTNDSKFLNTLKSWFQTQPEILVLIRYSHAAGSKDFEFFSSLESFHERIGRLPALTNLIAFKLSQLPIRGTVDAAFIDRCLSEIPDDSEYLMVETVKRIAGRYAWFHYGSGTSHAELREELKGSLGIPVAAGLYPPWLDDNADVISAVVPDEHGNTMSGVY